MIEYKAEPDYIPVLIGGTKYLVTPMNQLTEGEYEALIPLFEENDRLSENETRYKAAVGIVANTREILLRTSTIPDEVIRSLPLKLRTDLMRLVRDGDQKDDEKKS